MNFGGAEAELSLHFLYQVVVINFIVISLTCVILFSENFVIFSQFF